MRAYLPFVALAFAISGTAAVAQTNPPPQATYPMPPPLPAFSTTPGGHDALARIDATDRATRCLQYGTSIGVPSDQIQDYTRRCALQ